MSTNSNSTFSTRYIQNTKSFIVTPSAGIIHASQSPVNTSTAKAMFSFGGAERFPKVKPP